MRFHLTQIIKSYSNKISRNKNYSLITSPNSTAIMASSNKFNSQSTILTLEKELSGSSSESNTEQVREIGISEYAEAAQCLAEAFAVDDVARYFIDTEDMAAYSEEYKWRLHVDILRYITAAHCYKGIVTTIGPDYDAVALWYVLSNLFLVTFTSQAFKDRTPTHELHGKA